METYLTRFAASLRPYRGSLVKVSTIRHPHAKEYMAAAARHGRVAKVAWGWYEVPPKREPSNALEFLAADRNFKVITGQTAASYWNGDFVHRESVVVSVDDTSYGHALEAYAVKRGWSMVVEYDPHARRIPAQRIGGLRVETRERAITDCMKRWAFVDAIAALSPQAYERARKQAYWTRISGSDVRVGQALDYAAAALYGSPRRSSIRDEFVREQIDEAVAKVKDLE